MRESRTSGSVGGPGEQSPGPTRLLRRARRRRKNNTEVAEVAEAAKTRRGLESAKDRELDRIRQVRVRGRLAGIPRPELRHDRLAQRQRGIDAGRDARVE